MSRFFTKCKSFINMEGEKWIRARWLFLALMNLLGRDTLLSVLFCLHLTCGIILAFVFEVATAAFGNACFEATFNAPGFCRSFHFFASVSSQNGIYRIQ